MKRFFRALHRWLGILMAVQIIAWMISGLYFTLYPIEEIRGAHLIRKPSRVGTAAFAQLASPRVIAAALDKHFDEGWQAKSISLVTIFGQTSWRVEGSAGGAPFRRLVDGDGTGVIPSLSKAEAARVARDWLRDPGEITSVEWLDTSEPAGEYRGKPLPAWKVSFEQPEALNLYLDPWTREVLASRTTRWRIFDFLWMLHVLDFETRDDFNQPLLMIAAALGLIVALSGVIFWASTTSTLRRRRSPSGAGR